MTGRSVAHDVRKALPVALSVKPPVLLVEATAFCQLPAPDIEQVSLKLVPRAIEGDESR